MNVVVLYCSIARMSYVQTSFHGRPMSAEAWICHLAAVTTCGQYWTMRVESPVWRYISQSSRSQIVVVSPMTRPPPCCPGAKPGFSFT